MDAPQHPSVIGVVEVCDRLDASRDLVNKWRARPATGFPEPRWTVGGRPAWDWAEVEAWADATGRPVPYRDGRPTPA